MAEDQDIISQYVKGKSDSAKDGEPSHVGGPMHQKKLDIEDEYYKVTKLGTRQILDYQQK